MATDAIVTAPDAWTPGVTSRTLLPTSAGSIEGHSGVTTDPQAIENSRARHPQLTYSAELEETLRGADAVVLVTEWPEYRDIDPVWAASLVRTPTIIDGRNALDAAAWRAAGWTYLGLGRP
jgi:UDPglucose 6-dehydrogenase